MHHRSVLELLAILAAFLAAPQIRACGCTEERIVHNVRVADRIFKGQVLSAHISDSNPQVIRFVVEVEERFRGEPDERMSLVTPLPEACGVDVRPAFSDFYVLQAGEATVDSCSGSGRTAQERFPLLTFALALISYGEGQSNKALESLRQAFYEGYAREDMDQFFALVDRIDPAGRHVTRDDTGARFGDIRFIFRDGKLLSIEAAE